MAQRLAPFRLGLDRTQLERALGWWTGELRAMIPAAWRTRVDQRRPRVVLSLVADGHAVVRHFDARTKTEVNSDPMPLSAAAIEAARRASMRGESIELRLPFDAVYSRRVELPNVGASELRGMAELDLVRSTPFRLADVYSACEPLAQTAAGNTRALMQIVVRRKVVDPVVSQVELAGGRVRWLGCWDASGTSPLAVDLLPAAPAKASSKASGIAVTVAVALVASAFVFYSMRLGEALDEVSARLAAERKSAGAVQAALQASTSRIDIAGKLEMLRGERPSALLVMESLARVLPDTTHLQDLRISGDTVEMTGLGKGASELPQLLEKSGGFTDAVLTAPITADGNDERERFALRAKFRATAER